MTENEIKNMLAEQKIYPSDTALAIITDYIGDIISDELKSLKTRIEERILMISGNNPAKTFEQDEIIELIEDTE